MKKLILLLTITSISFGSMAMGFPQNTHEQQRALTKNIKSETLVKHLESSIEANIQDIVAEDTDSHLSIIETLVNYVVAFFTEKLLNEKVNAINVIEETKGVCVAIKKDFEYNLVA